MSFQNVDTGVSASASPAKKLRSEIVIAVGFLTFASVLAFFGRFSWLCDLLDQFRLPMAIAAALLSMLLLFMARRQQKLLNYAALSSLCVILNMVPIALMHITGKVSLVSNLKADCRLSVLQYNVFYANPNRSKFISYVRENSPDLLCIEEVNSDWEKELRGLSDLYPYQRIVPRPDSFGIAMLSRLPMHDTKVLSLCSCELPTIVTVIESGNRKILVVVTHPLPPLDDHCVKCRNEQLNKLAEMANNIGQSDAYLLCGDLNSVSWSLPEPFYRSLTEVTSSYLISQTWPTLLPEIFRIPIDHVFCNRGLKPVYQTCKDVCSSDHMGLLTGFSFKEEK